MKDLRDNYPMKKKAKKETVVDQVKKILDEEDSDNVILYDVNEQAVEFEQIALIPLEDKLYTILVPVTEVDGIEKGEGVLFEIDERKLQIEAVSDPVIMDKAIEIYNQLLEENE